MASIGIQIKEARRKEGLTQTELAEKLNCSVNTISRWENDKYSPSLDEINRIAEILNISFTNENIKEEVVDTYSNQGVVNVLEDIRLDMIRIESERHRIFVRFMVLIILLVIVFFIVLCTANWKSPKDSNESMVIEYLNEDSGL